MSNLQWFALGMMVAWTPTLVFMALMLWRMPDAELAGEQFS
jgi:hypothetical protein